MQYKSRNEGAFLGENVRFIEWVLAECGGCGEHAFLKRIIERPARPEGVELSDQDEAEMASDWFPPRMFRKLPPWVSDLSDDIRPVYQEIYGALDAGHLRLAVMGARALIENLMISRVGDRGSFKANMAAMVSERVISEEQKAFLESAIEAGHAVMHRSFAPDENVVRQLFDIVDAIVNITCVIGARSDTLRAATPPKAAKQ